MTMNLVQRLVSIFFIFCSIQVNSFPVFSDESNTFLRSLNDIQTFSDCGYQFIEKKWMWICQSKRPCPINEEMKTGPDFESTCKFEARPETKVFHSWTFLGSTNLRARCYCKSEYVRKSFGGACILKSDCPNW